MLVSILRLNMIAYNNSGETRELTLKMGNKTIVSSLKANSVNTIVVKK